MLAHPQVDPRDEVIAMSFGGGSASDRVDAKASFDARDRLGQRCSHTCSLFLFFWPSGWPPEVIERMF